ncbi:odorant receptor 85c-like [Anopheles darlingi]|uniref:odorant receptor 85c-like n=1 Tax=Anopheles darlingi TaxID=43151 RepID=UPI002100411B|nr:odorant receptor 85c-like [Anopheles darlingi]
MAESSEESTEVRFKSFIRVPEGFFDVIGVARYVPTKNIKRLRFVLFWSSFGNTAVCVVLEMIYFVLAARSGLANFLQLTALASCTGFSALSVAKIMTIKLHETKLKEMLRELELLFPGTAMLQDHYGVHRYYREGQLVMKSFSVLYMILIWIFNLMPLVSMVIGYRTERVWHKELPYFMWYWYDWHQAGYFEITFVQQNWGGFVSAVYNLSTDLMYCAFILLFCIQFDIVAQRLRHARPDDRAGLVETVRIHQKVIELCNQLERIFSPSLLVNFMLSSVIICLVGFQATAGVQPIDLFKFILFLISSLVQVFLLCYYGNKLIVASDQISYSAFEGHWINASSSYQKSLLLVMVRSLKPQKLTALKFSVISLASFSKILSTSFSYFTLLKAIYEP